VGKNVNKINVLVCVALFFCVLFGCKESKTVQSPLPIPKECENLFPKKEINLDFSKDSATFMECYVKYNGKKNIKCEESEFNDYSVCAIIHPKIFGYPRECLNFAKQKDSTAYYACCKKNNACWGKITSGDGVYVTKQLEYEWVNPDKENPKRDFLKDALPFIECLSTDPFWEKKECAKMKNDTNHIAYKIFNDVKMQKRLDSICNNLKDKPEFVKPCRSLGKGKE